MCIRDSIKSVQDGIYALGKALPKQQRLIGLTVGRDRRSRRAAYGNRHQPIEFCLPHLRRADGDCRDEPTDNVITSMTSRKFTARTSAYKPLFRDFLSFCLLIIVSVQSKSRETEMSTPWVP